MKRFTGRKSGERKELRLNYMKKRFRELEDSFDTVSDAVLPVTELDIEEESSYLDSMREHVKDIRSSNIGLNSDEL